MSELKHRIEELEKNTPGIIVLILNDGSERAFPGLSLLDFISQGIKEIRARRGPIFDVIGRAVDARNCGLLWQVLAVQAYGPLEPHSDGRESIC
jgi:hypothetical protein